ncbi:ethylene-responsive transcription factor ERF037-like [Abrus precatorius]|uniref:Ethylene-responsive transcription factor ERF037-like n=1 Tax=Abrus precatorius TaxID=3816 RepID=A0A8B8K2C4_ABRPR|nr:ethylene-responsive transcription factor ERF037-like [Abrus precatorius]
MQRQSQRRTENNKFRYRGVRQRSWSKWVAEISEPCNRTRKWLGTLSTSQDDARAYDRAAIILYDSKSQLNLRPSSSSSSQTLPPLLPHLSRLALSYSHFPSFWALLTMTRTTWYSTIIVTLNKWCKCNTNSINYPLDSDASASDGNGPVHTGSNGGNSYQNNASHHHDHDVDNPVWIQNQYQNCLYEDVNDPSWVQLGLLR